MESQAELAKKNNKKMLWNIILNIVIPSLILTKLSDPDRLGEVYALIIALAFPITYGTIELIQEKKFNFISVFGLVSVILTGGFSLLKLEGFWFAVKEGAIPLVIFLAVIFLHNTKYSLIRVFIYSPIVFNTDMIERKLAALNKLETFNTVLKRTNWILATSFLLSAILNFTLALVLLKSPTGTVAFNEELGRMMALSFPVIVIPCMILSIVAIVYLIKSIKKLTSFETEELFLAK